jgi:Holliday junction resolvasome RuvABC endonuclease subunit
MVNLSNFVNKPNRIVSIDASTNNIAYAIFEGDNLVRSGKAQFVGTDVFKKISSAVQIVNEVVREMNVDALVIERAVFINSPKTMSELSMVQGAIIAGASLAGVKIFKGTNPVAWQSFIGNKVLTKAEKLDIMAAHPGKSKSYYKSLERDIRKQRTINFVNINYDLSIDDNDIADAIGIGHYSLRNWEKLGD